jgi:YafQ family addiction module toxin component
MHKFLIEKKLEKIMIKLEKKNGFLYNQIKNKINEVINSKNIEHYKNLRHDLKEFKRVHIGHFVLIFRYYKKDNLISFEDFEHHDKIYIKKY